MKTKNNVQKAVLRSLAVFVSFVLISLTVSAQEFWKRILTNSSINEIAYVMVDSRKSDANNQFAELTADFMIQEQEEELDLENWMTTENNFISSYFLEEPDQKTELEKWMLNEDLFTVKNLENPLVLEDWMTYDLYWKM